MSDTRESLLQAIEADRDRLIDFFSRFVQAKSPNPPGDTREAVGFIRGFLEQEALPHGLIAPQPSMANIVGSFEGGAHGRHLVMNGHIDVFPVGENEPWTHGPWSGAVVDGRVYGRGTCDMKCGTAASIWTYRYLHQVRDQLRGRLTLTCVSDEETFGPWGARYLMEHHPEVHGDCLLNGEPSSPYSVRFGEKGILWLAMKVRTRGSHGAYVHASRSATKLAARLIGDLEKLADLEVRAPDNVMRALERNAQVIDHAMGEGAAAIMPAITVNIGRVAGGLKVNMVPLECDLEVDIRLPVGGEKAAVMAAVELILKAYPEVSVAEINFSPPSWCDPAGEMLEIIQDNAERAKGIRPEPIISLGGTDARLWRQRGIPAYVYGPPPRNMGSIDEYVTVDEYLDVVRVHVLSAFDYLTRDGAPA